MQDNTPVSITYGSAKRLKRLLGLDDRRPKNQHHPALPQSIYTDCFYAKIEGRTTTPIATIGNTKQLGAYAWNRIQTSETSAAWQFSNTNSAGNFGNYSQTNYLPYNIFEGDNNETTEQKNYAVESLYCSPNVLLGSIVLMRPSVTHTYYVFDYEPPIQFCVIEKDVPAATLSGGVMTFGVAECSPLNLTIIEPIKGSFYHNYKIGDGKDWRLTVYNPFRSEIKATPTKPIYAQIHYRNGSWFLAAVECDEVNGVF